MSNNLIICGIIVLLISTLMQSSNNQDNLTTLLYVVLICGIIYTLNKNGNLVNNTGTVNETFDEAGDVNGEPPAITNPTEPESEQVPTFEGNNENDVNIGSPSNNLELDSQFEIDVNVPQMTDGESVQISAEGLLPQKGNAWPNQPTVQSTASDELFFDAQSIIGMSSNVLRNASYDLRCAPSNPRVDVGPWQQTTMEPDLTRRPLEGPECGACNSGTSTN